LNRRLWLTRYLTSKVYGLAKLVSEIVTGINLDRSMVVGRNFHIIHPGIIYLAPGSTFGDDCSVMHGVTVGTVNDREGVPRMGNNVLIGAGACILGPVTIGDGARIGANSVVLQDVPPGATAFGVPARIYRLRPGGKGE
jgi:serine O-acetyltransferase